MADYIRQRRAAGIESAEYRAWLAMCARCAKPNHPAWKNYGARGITVCERWRQFSTFLSDMGRKPSPEFSLDRINNNGNYEPGNCRWATWAQQANNRRTNKRNSNALPLARSS